MVILATVGAAILVRRTLRGHAPLWTLPLATFAWTIVTFLYRPAITPDQPWASRRLVPAVLPGIILLAVWASAWLVGWIREHGLGRVASGGSAVVLAAALLVPAAIPTFGLGIGRGGPVGYRLTADGLAFTNTYWGVAAVDSLCAAIPANSTVVFVDGPARDRLPRGGPRYVRHPTARITPKHKSTVVGPVQQTVRSIERAGRQPGAARRLALGAEALRRRREASHDAEDRHRPERADVRAAHDHPLQPGHLSPSGAETVTAYPDRPQATAARGRPAVGPVRLGHPARYNEEGQWPAEVERICAVMDASGYRYELLAFDDAFHRRAPWPVSTRPRPGSRSSEIVPFHRNGGSGTVRRIGTQRARGEIVVWTDADMTYPNERIPELVQMLEKDPAIDQVVGARTSEQGTHKLLRVPAKCRDPQARRSAHQRQDPGPELRAQGVPACGCAAVPAAAAAGVLLRHHDYGRVPG